MFKAHFSGCKNPPDQCACERKRFLYLTYLSLGVLFIQITSGLLSNSIAILSDAFHTLVHGATFCIGIVAEDAVRRKRIIEVHEKDKLRFRYATAITFFVGVGVVIIAVEAWGRLLHPVPVIGGIMSIGAVVGTFGDVISTVSIHKSRRRDVIHRVIFWEVFLDSLSSPLILFVGVPLIYWLRIYWIDAVLSFLIAALMMGQTIFILATKRPHTH